MRRVGTEVVEETACAGLCADSDVFYSIEPSRAGTLTVIAESSTGRFAIHSTYDPVKEATQIIDSSRISENGIIVVLGLGLGYHVKELVERFPGRKVVVVEADRTMYELCMREGPLSVWPDNVEFLVGKMPDEALSEITYLQIKGKLEEICIVSLPASVRIYNDYYGFISRKLNTARKFDLRSRLRYRKFKQEKLRVALLDFNYFLKNEIKSTMKRLGHEVFSIEGDHDEDTGTFLRRLITAIYDYRPDFLISVNHNGFDEKGVIASFLESIEMPVAVWYVDSPRMIINAFRENIKGNKVLFLWDKYYIGEAKDIGFENVFYLPLATDETVFRFKKSIPEINVGFLGNSMVSIVNKLIMGMSAGYREIVEKYAGIMANKRISFKELTLMMDDEASDEMSRMTSLELQTLEAAIIQKASQLYRSRCVRMLEGLSPVIRGDVQWKDILSGGDFRIYPPLDYYTEAPQFYRLVKVNFNATNIQMPEGVNQRVFDVPAVGGFLLTDHQRDIDELFDPGKEVAVYESPEEINELVRYYLAHEEKRKKISMAARKRIIADHTYKQRLTFLIETMKRIYK
ncbi:MAG: hypothetical protein D6726_12120 [Nitrospirae bacterium]|nr:MAG: hypothetical protein D6726_12120 [Nitrospirota bacterium]